jgi:hypothetical protein
MEREPGRRGLLLRVTLMTGAALLIASCNAAVGGGLVALVGGAGFLAAQCYDRVRVRVRDPETGLATCSPDVWLSEGGSSKRRLRPCYSAALTEGRWTLTALQEGYAPATTELVIPEHEGDCPHYTHTVELTLRHEGEPPSSPVVTRTRTADEAPSAAAGPAAAGAGDLESPPARVVPPPIPGGSATPVVPTRSFDPLPLPSTAPAAPAPDAGAPH